MKQWTRGTLIIERIEPLKIMVNVGVCLVTITDDDITPFDIQIAIFLFILNL